MLISSLIQTAVPIAGALGVGAWITPGPWHGTPAPAEEFPVAQIVAQAPAILRPAVQVLADPALTEQMLTTLKLGSPLVGFPGVQGWDYARHGLTVDLWMLGGQCFEDWNNDNIRSQMATYLGVRQVTVSSPAASWVRLQVRVHDTLAEPATLPDLVHNEVDLEAVPVGIREDGDTWRVQVLYRHILIAGAMGSGKGSVLWSIIAGLGPAIKAGLVDVLMGDPKGGMEFGRGEHRLWVDFQWTAEGIIGMLKTAEKDMQDRAARLREARVRKFVPSVEDPLILIVIDEYAALSAFATREEMQEAMRLLGLILTQGRAVGFSVMVALQDPSKETMPNRQLFPVRIGLKLDEPTQNSMIHGQGAKDRGARCHEIPDTTPGVAYVGEDGTREFVRARAYYVSDDDADAIVDAYSPADEITGPTQDYSDFDPDDLGEEIPGDGGFADPAVAA
ncbi:FtsK/SpoIIIE domain-containing protein [Nocardia sp. NPDC052001]|uniref:FtsK/SpoIIIE domain-containing protein n=1 Tax=Nocardia sp. NPDC052001 TaxID=3154853 RepID=UPI00341F469C